VSTPVSTLREQLLTFDIDKFTATVKNLIKEGLSPVEVVNALTEVLKEVGRKYENGEMFLIHLVSVGDMTKRVTSEVLEPLLKIGGGQRNSLGRIVIGTVAGDIHDIGKTIVATMFFSAGFEVVDLGRDVSVEEFVRKAEETNADIVAMSALLTTTLPVQREVVEALKNSGLRNRVKILVGGAPATAKWAEEIGADGYAGDPMEAIKVAKRLLGLSQ
jgi:methylmalonyl-CoA mutase cobalamin-binding domain/chain